MSGLPSWCSSHVSPRALSTRSAIMSVAVSRSSSSHSVALGRRYLTLYSRRGLFTYCSEADPLGHRRPREIGLSGSPSIWTTFSSLTYTFCPQPTAQYGHTERTTRSAVAVRGVRVLERGDCAARPRPRGSRSWRSRGGSRSLQRGSRFSLTLTGFYHGLA